MASVLPTKTDEAGKPARDTRWKARYRDPNGRPRSRTFDRKVDGERFLRNLGTSIDRGEWIDPRVQRTTFGHWADLWWGQAQHLRPATLKGYRTALEHRLRPRFGTTPIGAIDRPAVKAYVAELGAEGLAPKTVANIALVLRLVLAEAVEGGALRENPARGLRLPRARKLSPRFLTPEEVEDLANAAREPYGFLLRFAAYTGLRPSELCGLRVGRVDLLRRRCEVSETLMMIDGRFVVGPTKTFATRSVPLPRFLADEAATFLAWRRETLGRPLDPNDYVFPPLEQSGGRATAEHLVAESIRRYVLKPAAAAAGLPSDLRTHDLRHTAAAMLVELGAHPRAIMERLGHSDIAVTLNVYGHLFPSLEAALTDGLEELRARAVDAPRPEAVTALRR